VLGALGASVALLAVILIANMLRLRPAPRGAPVPPRIDATGASAVVDHLAAAIRFRTISHEDPAQDQREELARFRAWLETTYPAAHAALKRELVNGDGLLFRWEGTSPAAKPILLMAHQDVVPVEPGAEPAWAKPPFDGVVADGFVWGRGAIDDKGPLVALFEALEMLAGSGFRPVIIPVGAIVEADNPAVLRFPSHFRPATPNDIRIANARRLRGEEAD